eukprot:s1576_g7.t1
MLNSQCEFEDDAAEVARERVALLELSQAGVNLMEFTRIMAEQLPQDQEGLDLVEESGEACVAWCRFGDAGRPAILHLSLGGASSPLRCRKRCSERLPARSVLEKLPPEQAKQIREACNEANKRLHARLDDHDAWEEDTGCMKKIR